MKDNLIEGKKQDLDDKLEERNDWESINMVTPTVKYSKSRDSWHCEEHIVDLTTSSRLTLHLHKFHGVNQDGSDYVKKGENEPEEPPKPSTATQELKKAFNEPLDDDVQIGEDAFEIHKKKRAEAISRIMDNPYVSMFFVESRSMHMFPPSFDEGDIIREALEYLGMNMGFSINVGYNPKTVTDPVLRKKMLYSSEQWDKEGDSNA